MGWQYTLTNQNETPEYWIGQIDPQLALRFDSLKIMPHDRSTFYECTDEDEPIDKNRYLEQIKKSTWCGPYKDDEYDRVYFFSIASSGDNEYYLWLELGLTCPRRKTRKSLSLFFRKECCDIAPFHNLEL